jgi:pullulanase/glycogen debranching enzyme
MTTWSEAEGSPQPPGAICFEKEKSYNFSLYSRHATGVTLLLYTARDLVNPALRVPLNHLIHKIREDLALSAYGGQGRECLLLCLLSRRSEQSIGRPQFFRS